MDLIHSGWEILPSAAGYVRRAADFFVRTVWRWKAEDGRLKQGHGHGRPMQEGQGNGTAEENTEKMKFVDEYGLWLGGNSAIVHIVRSGTT